MAVNMRSVLVLYVSLAFVLLLSHAQNDQEAKSVRTVDNFATFPSIVIVEGDVPEERSCGGTLIGDHVVLTAAQCVVGSDNTTRLPKVVLDAMNAQRTDQMPQTRITMETVVYPGYTGTIRDGSDFALLRLDSSVAPLQAVQIHDGTTPFEAHLVTIGAAGEEIQVRPATVADPAECENAGKSLDKDSMICMAGDIPCEGDEGGPILDVETGDLVAVVSLTAACRSGSTHLAVVTVRSPKVLGWIRGTLNAMESTASLNQAPAVIAFDGPSNPATLSVPAPESEKDLEDEEEDEEMVYDLLDFL